MATEELVEHEAIEEAAQERLRRVARLRRAAARLDSQPALLHAVRRLRRRLPGDEQFGDPLSTAEATAVALVARGVSSLQPERESVLQELGLTGLQLWQSVSEATGRGRGDTEMALIFTDLVGFSAWALKAGDTSTLSLLRDVGVAEETAVAANRGQIIKRLGDGLMASFLSAQDAVLAALEVQEAVNQVEIDGYQPRVRVGVHWGRPRRLGGDLLGIDVNIAARVGEAAKADQVLASDAVLVRLDPERFEVGRRKRLKAEGAPRDLQVAPVCHR